MSEATKIEELLRLLVATRPEEIDCDEFLVRVGAYLENLQSSDEMSPELRLVSQHLEVCGECSEELEALLRIYGEESSD